MGVVFEEFYMGTSTVDDYLAVHDEWTIVDDELLIVLEGLGSRFDRRAIQNRAITQSMKALGRAAQGFKSQ